MHSGLKLKRKILMSWHYIYTIVCIDNIHYLKLLNPVTFVTYKGLLTIRLLYRQQSLSKN